MERLIKRKLSLCDEVADRLQKDIRDRRFAQLPSIRVLTVAYHVGTTTMWKAVRLLAKRGILTVERGRRIRLPGDRPPSAGKALCATMRARIADGSFRMGRPLPKYAFLQKAHCVSADTVVAAFEQLGRESLIHKVGRVWVVGASQRSNVAPAIRPSRVVVILLAHRANWFDLNENSFTRPFTSALLGEFRDAGVHVQLAIQRLDSRVASIPAGPEETMSLIRELGDRYIGMLASFQLTQRRVAQWIYPLCMLRKPVVVFDNRGSLAGLGRDGINEGSHYFRCFFDEPGAIAIAIKALKDLGHQRVGLLHTSGSVAWMKNRLDQIEGTAARIAPGMVFFRACLEDEFGVFDDDRSRLSRRIDDPHDIDSFIVKLGSPERVAGWDLRFSRKDPGWRTVWEKSRSLRQLLQVNKTTAWIAPNDFYQRKLYVWARYVGLDVPGDLSLVSFDNTTDSYLFPLASIDPGFSYLGYLAAHALIGDISVTTDSRGHIAGQCRLVDRGSLGKPRESEESIEMLAKRLG